MNPFPACLALCLCLWIRTSASLLRVCSSNCYEFVHSFMRSTSPNVPDCPLAYYYQTHSSVNLLPNASSLWFMLCVSEIPFYKANARRSPNWILTRFREWNKHGFATVDRECARLCVWRAGCCCFPAAWWFHNSHITHLHGDRRVSGFWKLCESKYFYLFTNYCEVLVIRIKWHQWALFRVVFQTQRK